MKPAAASVLSKTIIAPLLAATVLVGCGTPSTSTTKETQNPAMTRGQMSRVVDATTKGARAIDSALRATDRFGSPVVSAALFEETKCIIGMNIWRGAFLLGGEGGEGVMTCRLPEGGWSAPSYVRTGGFELSAAIGFDNQDIAMLITDVGLAESYKAQLNFDTRAYASAVAANASAALHAAGRYGMAVIQTNNQGLYAGVGITFSSMSHMQAERNQVVYQEVLGGGTPVDENARLCTSYVLPRRERACIANYEYRTGNVMRTVTADMILSMSADWAPEVTRPLNDVMRHAYVGR